ncbi:MAG: DNA polymerase III subunit gamma/tau [Actinomycetota bacterium]|nr:DNA polymerase III subunit gamma/tau [Actinomycetota bacterium]
MAHLSLYRKYRPQKFAEVVGQGHVTRTLQAAVRQKRVAHALLFSGPRGTGKTTSARILAKVLNCERQGDEPCDECSSCLQIASGMSLDVVEIDAASHGSVDDARDLREKVAYSSVSGRWKVYIIDECHMLSPAANNALLKVLEEPPEHVVFVFATTEPHKVLQTLLDRCQRYEFRAVTAADITKRLSEVCRLEGITSDEHALSLVSARAGGSVRDALGLLEQLRSFAGDTLQAGDLAQLLGGTPEDLLFEAVDLISERDIGAVFLFADRLVRSGIDIREFIRGLTQHLRSLFLVLHAPAAQEILETTDEHLERLQAQANRFESAEVLRLIDLANETQLQLRQAVEGRLALEVGLARMTRPDLHAAPASLLTRIERIEKQLGIQLEEGLPASAVATAPIPVEPKPVRSLKPVSTSPTSPEGVPEVKVADAASSSEEAGERHRVPGSPAEPSPLADGEVDLEKTVRAWPVILDKVKRRKISFHAVLLAAKPVAWENGDLVLEFGPRSRFHRDKVADPSQHVPLLDAFNEVLGVRPRVRCVMPRAIRRRRRTHRQA